MQFKNIAILAATLGLASAQSLTEVLTANSASLSTLISLLENQPEIVAALGEAQNITILAPSNEAFAEFVAANEGITEQTDVVAALLQYHVLSSLVQSTDFTETSAFVPTLLTNETYTTVEGGQVVEGVLKDGGVSVFSGGKAESKVSTADVKFDGGVVHVIDKVLTIPGLISETAVAADLTTLAEALTSADLVETVDTLEQATVFAPTNEAFEAIADTVAGLTPEQLSAVLTYHVVSGAAAYSSGLESGEVPTVNGQSVNIEVTAEGVKVNDANVVIKDVLVKNGVVHVIDAVLVPEFDDDAMATTTMVSAGPSGTTTGSAPTTTFTGAATRATGAIAAAVLMGAGAIAAAL